MKEFEKSGSAAKGSEIHGDGTTVAYAGVEKEEDVMLFIERPSAVYRMIKLIQAVLLLYLIPVQP